MQVYGLEQDIQIIPGQSGPNHHIFSVLLKRTYDIRHNYPLRRSDSVVKLLETDIYYDQGDPEWSTVKFESEVAPYKPKTDVVIIGKAMAPGTKPVSQLSVGVEVAGQRKIILVTGNRHCVYRQGKAPEFTDPDEFTDMEIRYEKAYGGKDLTSNPELPFYYPRNHLGTGVAVTNQSETVDGLALPNLEDKNDLLTPERVILNEPERWNEQPFPQGFGWFQRTWYPRCSFVGSVPGFVSSNTKMREEEYGLVPKGQIALARQFKLPSMDARFNNGASLGLAFPYLKGNELIRTINLTLDGLLAFRLPGEQPTIMLDIGLGENQLDVVMHTVCVRLEDQQVDLIWRGAHPYPGIDWIPKMTRMHVEVV